MIFGINLHFESYNVLLTKYSCAAYDCFCAAGSDITVNVMNTLYRYRLYRYRLMLNYEQFHFK